MKNFLFTGFIILLLSAVSCKTTEKGSMTQTQTPTSQTNEKKNISINREELNGTWIIKTAKGKTVIGDSPVEITFDLTNGRIYGNDGCNVINGTAFFENEWVTFRIAHLDDEGLPTRSYRSYCPQCFERNPLL